MVSIYLPQIEEVCKEFSAVLGWGYVLMDAKLRSSEVIPFELNRVGVRMSHDRKDQRIEVGISEKDVYVHGYSELLGREQVNEAKRVPLGEHFKQELADALEYLYIKMNQL